MSCCRGKNRRTSAVVGPAFCKTLEEGGARFLVWPLVTTKGLELVANLPINGSLERVSLLPFLNINAKHCQGPTALWLKSQLPLIVQAVTKKPEYFARYYASSGITLSKLANVSKELIKRDAGKLQAHSSV